MFGLLMSAIAVALVSTICAVGLRPRHRPPGAVAWSRRLVFALLGTAVLAIFGGLVDAFVTGGRPRQVALGGVAAALTHAGSMGGILTAALLVLPTWAFASAPSNSLAARRAIRPTPDSRPDVEVPAQTGRLG